MNELVKKYRAAPRQVSPLRLDNLILAKAEQKTPVKRPSLMVMSPWKTMAASLCVVGLGVTLLLRYGVPPLVQQQGATTESADVTSSLKPSAEQPMADFRQQKEPLVIESDSRSVAQQEFEAADLDHVVLAEKSESAMIETREDAAADLATADVFSAEPDTSAISMSPTSSVQAIETAPGMELAAAPASLAMENARLGENDSALAVREEGVAVVLTDEMFAEEIVSGATANASRSQSAVGESNEYSTSVSVARSPSLSLSKNLAADSSVQASKRLSKQAAAKDPIAEIEPQADPMPEIQKEFVAIDAYDWIASQPAAHFTLQLATAPDADYLDDFARSLNLTQNWYVVELGRNRSDNSVKSFGLLYGVFETSNKALTHIDTLDEKSRQFGPWVRSFKRLRDEVTKP